MRKYDDYLGSLEGLSQAPEQDLSNGFVQAGVIHKFVLQSELSSSLARTIIMHEHGRRGPQAEIEACSMLSGVDRGTWMSMAKDRTAAPAVCDQEGTEQLVGVIIDRYLPAFQRLADGVRERYGDGLERLP